MIKFKNVHKHFKDLHVINDVSLEVGQGEVVVVCGPSGSGKSTLIRTVNQLESIESGEIWVDGINVADPKTDLNKVREEVGFVFQSFNLYPHLTVLENIILSPMKVKKQSLEQAQKKAMELLERVGLAHKKDALPSQLSGGQQQRIGVARAFANEPEIILFDEPFSALDPITRSALQDQLIHIQSNEAKTMVFVTHDMGEAIKIADRICILNEGRVVQFDTPENIMKYPADEFVESFVGLNRIWSSPKYIKVQDFMITEPISVREDVSAYKCIRILRSHHIDTLPVVDSEGTLLGIIGRQSFLNRPLPSSRDRDIMYSAQHTVHPDENILDVLTTIRETDVSNLPVIDDNGRIIGLLTSSRLIATMSQQFLDNMSEEEVK